MVLRLILVRHPLVGYLGPLIVKHNNLMAVIIAVYKGRVLMLRVIIIIIVLIITIVLTVYLVLTLVRRGLRNPVVQTLALRGFRVYSKNCHLFKITYRKVRKRKHFKCCKCWILNLLIGN